MIENKRQLRPVIEEGNLGINPFLSSLKVVVSKVTTGDRFRREVDNKSGDIWTSVPSDFEAEAYTKVFTEKGRRLDMAKLSPRVKDLLLWIIYECDLNNDWIWINKQRYMQESGVKSMNTFRDAVTELIKTAYLVKTCMTDVYWINPHYFFNGNRLKNFPDNIVVKK